MDNRTFLISYTFNGGVGRFFHYRDDGKKPSEDNILTMEQKLEDPPFKTGVLITCISEIEA